MKKLFYILFVLPAIMFGQTATVNHIRTLTYKDSTLVTDPAKAHAAVTYYDGIGRPVQQVAGKASATGKDIITHIEYDAFGRQPKEYLPYEGSGTNLEFTAPAAAQQATLQFYATPQYDNTPNPYSEKIFESSPLNRVKKQGAPGAVWAVNPNNDQDHAIKFGYDVNAANEVKLLTAGTSWDENNGIFNIAFNDGGFYSQGQLYKTVTKDENWTAGNDNTVQEFTNRLGQVVLKRAFNNGSEHDTYYVYDRYGNLTYVLPPLADGQFTEGLCYQYKYDQYNRLAEKKLPGKAWEYIVFDSLNRVVATGPALSPWGGAAEGWLYTYYDGFGRIALTGWKQEAAITTAARITLQNDNLWARALNRGNGNVDNVTIDYSSRAVDEALKLLTVNYYDDYAWLNPFTPRTDIEGQPVLASLKGLATGSWVRVLTTPDEAPAEVTYTFYDKKARPIRTHKTNYLGGYTRTDSMLDFAGKTIYTITKHKRLAAETELAVREDFTYTAQDRLLKLTHQVNSSPVELLSFNEYDALGQLVSKRVGNTDLSGALAHQKVDYSHNIRGWLTDINKITGLSDDPNGPEDLFAFRINYYDEIPEALNVSETVTPLYNGNISQTFWKSGSDDIVRNYGYRYDALNRLKTAWYHKANQLTQSYNEQLSYDKNGNIRTLQRNGDYDDAIQPIEIDNLTYTYDPVINNRLMMVAEESNSTSGFSDSPDNDVDDYAYDNYGNMISDRNKYITGITYNHLNLPVEIQFELTGKIAYLYNATGQKVRKSLEPAGRAQPVETDYLDGFQYMNAILQYFPTAEGYVENTKTAKARDVLSYVYQYKDHLGNIRINYALDPLDNVLKIKEENHYYPFGLKHNNYNVDYLGFMENEEETSLMLRDFNFPFPFPGDIEPLNPNKAPYNYKYQGQERQEELGLNWDSFKWRNYDYAIGRFMTIDPLAEDYVYNSPYAFAENRVVDGRELEGLEWRSSTSSDGKTVNMTLTARTVNNSGGIISNKQMGELASARAAQLSKTMGGTDSQGRTVNVSVNFSDNATMEWSYTNGNDTSHKTYSDNEDGFMEQMGDAMAFGLTDKIGDTQNNRTQVNVGSIEESVGKVYNKTLRKFVDSPNAKKERADAATQTGTHEDGHTLGGRHDDDPANKNKNQGNNQNHLMNSGSTGTEITPQDRTNFVNQVEKQQPR